MTSLEKQSTTGRRIAIVGLGKQTFEMCTALESTGLYTVVKILDPASEKVSDLLRCMPLFAVINTLSDQRIQSALEKLFAGAVMIIDPLKARILFGSPSQAPLSSSDSFIASLNNIMTAFHLSKDKNEILKLVLNLALKVANADSGSIMLLDKNKRHLKIEIAYGLDEKVKQSTIPVSKKGIAGSVLRSKSPLLMNGPVDPSHYTISKSRPEIVSAICSPIIAGKESIGVLNVNSKVPGRVFGDRDVFCVSNLADFTAEMLSVEESHKLASMSEALLLENGIRDIFSMRLDFNERLHLAALRCANICKAETCNIYEYDLHKNIFISRSASSFAVTLAHGDTHKLNDTVAKKVLDTQQCVIESYQNGHQSLNEFIIAQPIFLNDHLWGIFLGHWRSINKDFELRSSILERIAKVISNEIRREYALYDAQLRTLKNAALSDLAIELTEKQSIEQLKQKIISSARTLFDSQAILLRLCATNGNLSLCGFLSNDPAADQAAFDAIDRRITADASPMGVPILIADCAQSPYSDFKSTIKTGICSALRVGQYFLGTLSVYNCKRTHRTLDNDFTEADKELFKHFCQITAYALLKCTLNGNAAAIRKTATARIRPKSYEGHAMVRQKAMSG